MNTTEMLLPPMFSGSCRNPDESCSHQYHILQRLATNSIQKLMLMRNHKTQFRYLMLIPSENFHNKHSQTPDPQKSLKKKRIEWIRSSTEGIITAGKTFRRILPSESSE
jgi:hypothetical protein